MNGRSVRIRYPRADHSFLGPYIVATGIALPDCQHLAGVVKGSMGTRAQGRFLGCVHGNHQWIMIAKLEGALPPDQRYTLQICQESDPSAVLADVGGLRRHPDSFKVEPGLGVQIAFPSDSSSHCHENFIAYGYKTPPDQSITVATMTLDTTVTNASFIGGEAEDEIWVAQFPALTPGNGYVLDVTGSGAGTDKRQFLELASGLC